MTVAGGEACISHPLLDRLGVSHGFGTRDSGAPADTLLPIQVHGADVIHLDRALLAAQNQVLVKSEADAIATNRPATSVAIVTADCLPILACCESGRAVVAIHAGWRGLAKGVVEAGIEALRKLAPAGESLYAVIGPHIGSCCYEVDEPVLAAMSARFGAEHVSRASSITRPGHAQLSLADLAEASLHRSGVGAGFYGRLAQSCTACEGDRFHSFRRSGRSAGRMTHFIVTI